MTSLNISLPEALREWVDERVSTGGYSTASELVRALIRDAQKQEAKERLESALWDQHKSPPPGTEITAQDWRKLRKRFDKGLEKLLLEGLDSGPGIEATPEYWRQLRERVEKRVAGRQDSR